MKNSIDIMKAMGVQIVRVQPLPHSEPSAYTKTVQYLESKGFEFADCGIWTNFDVEEGREPNIELCFDEFAVKIAVLDGVCANSSRQYRFETFDEAKKALDLMLDVMGLFVDLPCQTQSE